jgi:hypothetical protein
MKKIAVPVTAFFISYHIIQIAVIYTSTHLSIGTTKYYLNSLAALTALILGIILFYFLLKRVLSSSQIESDKIKTLTDTVIKYYLLMIILIWAIWQVIPTKSNNVLEKRNSHNITSTIDSWTMEKKVKNLSYILEDEDHWKPQNPEITINPKKWMIQEPQAWSYSSGWLEYWLYNATGAYLESVYLGKRIPTLDEWIELIDNKSIGPDDKIKIFNKGFLHCWTEEWKIEFISYKSFYWTSSLEEDFTPLSVSISRWFWSVNEELYKIYQRGGVRFDDEWCSGGIPLRFIKNIQD